MSQLLALCCDIDDLCTWFEPLYRQRLLQDGQWHRVRQSPLAWSELMTSSVCCPRRHDRDCKHYDLEDVEAHLRPSCPALVSYRRLVALLPRARVPWCGSRHTRPGRGTGMPCVEATS